MPDIFDEVSEDLRAERARALLRRYGIVLVGLMVLTLVAVGLYDWQERQTGASRAVTADRFIAAQNEVSKHLTNPGRPLQAAVTDSFSTIAASGPAGYQVLARLQLAAIDWDAGRHDKAVAAWKAVSDDAAAPQPLRDLATLTSAQRQVDTGDAATLKSQVSPLVMGASRWRPLAEQITALLDIRLGRVAEAKAIMKSLALDGQAPPGVRQMAQDLLTTLGE